MAGTDCIGKSRDRAAGKAGATDSDCSNPQTFLIASIDNKETPTQIMIEV
jgi:hypothetical protein